MFYELFLYFSRLGDRISIVIQNIVFIFLFSKNIFFKVETNNLNTKCHINELRCQLRYSTCLPYLQIRSAQSSGKIFVVLTVMYATRPRYSDCRFNCFSVMNHTGHRYRYRQYNDLYLRSAWGQLQWSPYFLCYPIFFTLTCNIYLKVC